MEVVKFQQAKVSCNTCARTPPPSAVPPPSSNILDILNLYSATSWKRGCLPVTTWSFGVVVGYAYADTVDEHRTGERMIGRMGGGPLGRGGIFWIRVVVVLIRSRMLVRAELVRLGRSLWRCFAVCHTIIPEVKDGKMVIRPVVLMRLLSSQVRRCLGISSK